MAGSRNEHWEQTRREWLLERLRDASPALQQLSPDLGDQWSAAVVEAVLNGLRGKTNIRKPNRREKSVTFQTKLKTAVSNISFTDDHLGTAYAMWILASRAKQCPDADKQLKQIVKSLQGLIKQLNLEDCISWDAAKMQRALAGQPACNNKLNAIKQFVQSLLTTGSSPELHDTFKAWGEELAGKRLVDTRIKYPDRDGTVRQASLVVSVPPATLLLADFARAFCSREELPPTMAALKAHDTPAQLQHLGSERDPGQKQLMGQPQLGAGQSPGTPMQPGRGSTVHVQHGTPARNGFTVVAGGSAHQAACLLPVVQLPSYITPDGLQPTTPSIQQQQHHPQPPGAQALHHIHGPHAPRLDEADDDLDEDGLGDGLDLANMLDMAGMLSDQDWHIIGELAHSLPHGSLHPIQDTIHLPNITQQDSNAPGTLLGPAGIPTLGVQPAGGDVQPPGSGGLFLQQHSQCPQALHPPAAKKARIQQAAVSQPGLRRSWCQQQQRQQDQLLPPPGSPATSLLNACIGSSRNGPGDAADPADSADDRVADAEAERDPLAPADWQMQLQADMAMLLSWAPEEILADIDGCAWGSLIVYLQGGAAEKLPWERLAAYLKLHNLYPARICGTFNGKHAVVTITGEGQAIYHTLKPYEMPRLDWVDMYPVKGEQCLLAKGRYLTLPGVRITVRRRMPEPNQAVFETEELKVKGRAQRREDEIIMLEPPVSLTGQLLCFARCVYTGYVSQALDLHLDVAASPSQTIPAGTPLPAQPGRQHTVPVAASEHRAPHADPVTLPAGTPLPAQPPGKHAVPVAASEYRAPHADPVTLPVAATEYRASRADPVRLPVAATESSGSAAPPVADVGIKLEVASVSLRKGLVDATPVQMHTSSYHEPQRPVTAVDMMPQLKRRNTKKIAARYIQQFVDLGESPEELHAAWVALQPSSKPDAAMQLPSLPLPHSYLAPAHNVCLDTMPSVGSASELTKQTTAALARGHGKRSSQPQA